MSSIAVSTASIPTCAASSCMRRAPCAEVVGGELRLEIEAAFFRLARVFGDKPEHAAIKFAGTAKGGGRDADAFLEHAQRVGGDGARNPAADIGVMTDIRGEKPWYALDEDRRY